MISILRIYDPGECSADGIQLDWDRCRACFEGTGRVAVGPKGHPCGPLCDVCGGHGSLKAAVLAEILSARLVGGCCPLCHGLHPGHHAAGCAWTPARCESCSHPMSEGTWEANAGADMTIVRARAEGQMVRAFRGQVDPNGLPPQLTLDMAIGLWDAVHYSACDSLCDHHGPYRYEWNGIWESAADGRRAGDVASDLSRDTPPRIVEASWRPVGIRTLGWPHDLRPEKLAVLCLRCFAERARP